ncbi:signal peptide peptidase SppA [Novosphingobium rosa]|uniref:signal peptide peptidase SppA n=1 Tax=Novosphingobium rosa TaxID=76978 RepID=UPI0008362884|nr:signal peptide peptidase SppA [Novosphingobium rosa]
MIFARKVWNLLVAIKDALVLVMALLFFFLLFAALTARGPSPQVRKGALLIKLDGAVVEELPRLDPATMLTGGGGAEKVVRERDVVRALKGAVADDKIRAVAIDMSGFSGGGLVHLEEIGAAMDAVKAAKKPVLVYGMMLDDAGMLMAAHGSEVWLDPLGGAFVPGPGGYRPYFGPLLEKLMINVHVFRVGTYKDFVEPYIRNGMSDPSRESNKALIGSIWSEWQANVAKARPQADIAGVVKDPLGLLKAAGGDAAQAALKAKLVDRIGNRTDFGQRVADVAGDDRNDKRPGAFAHTSLDTWVAANPESTKGKAIGVITIAGDITDGKEGPGTAGGARIAALIDSAQQRKLSALVVRVDSPGGSVVGAEAIRAAIERQKKLGLPIVVSMANYAASGGYWVSTPATRIFAQPGTITGSIGIFAVVPSFEKALSHWGVTGDGVRTTPLSGQPDLVTGLTPEVEALLQADIEGGYGRFIKLVANSRHKTPEEVDAIAQGRVWDGGTARQKGLVDAFGGLDDALAYAADQAKLKDGEWHPEFLQQKPSALVQLAQSLRGNDDDSSGNQAGSDDDGHALSGDLSGLIAARQQMGLARMVAQARMLMGAQGAQARCVECSVVMGAGVAPQGGLPGQSGWSAFTLMRLAQWVGIAPHP